MDPLRSLTNLLDSLWTSASSTVSRSDAVARSGQVTAQRNSGQAAAARSEDNLRLRLRARIAVIGDQDPKRARAAFVETVLAWQFGDNLHQDPQFAELARKLSSHIEAEPALSERLTELLREFAQQQAQK